MDQRGRRALGFPVHELCGMSVETDIAELIELGGQIHLAKFDRPWTSVTFPNRKWRDRPDVRVELADTTPHPQALADILAMAKADVASGELL